MAVETKICTTCVGTGQCFKCEGTGHFQTAGKPYTGDVHPGPGTGSVQPRACPECNGTGTCQACAGTGHK